jgi:hypothetical protein
MFLYMNGLTSYKTDTRKSQAVVNGSEVFLPVMNISLFMRETKDIKINSRQTPVFGKHVISATSCRKDRFNGSIMVSQ